jgi:glycyl-tRNA synthetase beta subunit
MIYTVEITYRTVVQADSREQAIEAAKYAARDEITEVMNEAEIWINEITHLNELPTPWDGNCLPWSGDGKTPLKDILT